MDAAHPTNVTCEQSHKVRARKRSKDILIS